MTAWKLHLVTALLLYQIISKVNDDISIAIKQFKNKIQKEVQKYRRNERKKVEINGEGKKGKTKERKKERKREKEKWKKGGRKQKIPYLLSSTCPIVMCFSMLDYGFQHRD